MDKIIPRVVILGSIGSGISTLCNSLFNGWTFNLRGEKRKQFRTTSNHQEACTVEIEQIMTETLFGIPYYGSCIIVNTIGFSGESDEIPAKKLLEYFQSVPYVTLVIVVLSIDNKLTFKGNMNLIALLMHIFGEKYLKNIAFCINKWPADPNSERMKQIQEDYGNEHPENIIEDSIQQICKKLRESESVPSLILMNPYHLKSELYFWGYCQYKFVNHLTDLCKGQIKIDASIKSHIEFWKNDIKTLVSCKKNSFDIARYIQFTKSIKEAENKIEPVLYYWKGYLTLRVFIHNDTDFKLTKTLMDRKKGYYENNTTNNGYEKLDQVDIAPKNAICIFQREGWGSGLEGRVIYDAALDHQHYELSIGWNVVNDKAKILAYVFVGGTFITQGRIKYRVESKNEDTPSPILTVIITQ